MRNVSSNSVAPAEDKPLGEALPRDTMSEIDDTCLRSSATAKPHPFRRMSENTCNKSSASRMRFSGRTGGNSTTSSDYRFSLLGLAIRDPLLNGIASDMADRPVEGRGDGKLRRERTPGQPVQHVGDVETKRR